MSPTAAVNDYDRFSFAVFVALLVHLLIIFGIGFSLPEKQNSATTLDITLAQTSDSRAPDEADFLAQANQEGSGTLSERAEMTTTELADYAAEDIRKTQRLQQTASAPRPKDQSFQSITSLMADFDIQSHQLEQELKALQLPEGPTKSLLERSLEIASLEAKLDRQRQTLTKAPRTKRLTATSTRQSSDALYMNQWLRKIESTGNLNYPAEAIRQNISGSLRLLVAVRADGTIHEIKVMESSGHKVLDDAAKRIVHLAAPFAPFSEEMRKQADILEIIRTWQFQQTQFSTNS
ncbi:MAG: energy transducer TonB [Gammaproteobacteria bacterium]|nr:energy transducer TonB [Gammaproteobacteria bacterium]